ncbi:MAG: ABC transporter ATP-binding protein [Bacillota bacterium]
MISVNNLKHTYDGQVYAVDDVSFDISKGEIFGFLGPNGAGKSTTQKILIGLLKLQEGKVSVGGFDLEKLDNNLFNLIGVCFEQPNLYKKLTGLENLVYQSKLYGVPTYAPMELLKRVNLVGAENKKTAAYSKGMQQRLMLARSLINKPKIWFLDEPLSGLDPESALDMKELIKEQREQGVTIFLTTHNMFVAEELCDRVAFIHQGKIVALDTPRSLKIKFGKHLVKVEYRNSQGLQKETLSLDLAEDKLKLQRLIAEKDVETIHSQEATLEEIFVKLTGRGLK